jgi:hypothetical protein
MRTGNGRHRDDDGQPGVLAGVFTHEFFAQPDR